MARYDTRPWRWTSARTCSSISSKVTTPSPPVRIRIGTHGYADGGMVELRAHSSSQGLFHKSIRCRTIFYTRYLLQKQEVGAPLRRTLFRTPPRDISSMASIDRTAYPRFRSSLTAHELQGLYRPSHEEQLSVP